MERVKGKMYQARLLRNEVKAHGVASMQGREQESITPDSTDAFNLPRKLGWLAGGMTLGAMAVFMYLGSGPYNTLSGTAEQRQHDAAMDSGFTNADAESAGKDIVLLTAQVQALAASVTSLEGKLTNIHAMADSIALRQGSPVTTASLPQVTNPGSVDRLDAFPPPAAGMRIKGAPAGSGDDAPKVIASTAAAANGRTAPAVALTQEPVAERSPWVIYVASLSSEADARHFADNIRSKGVDADITQASVRGKSTWRVFVHGFSSADEAKAGAVSIKEKLGITSAWIARQ